MADSAAPGGRDEPGAEWPHGSTDLERLARGELDEAALLGSPTALRQGQAVLEERESGQDGVAPRPTRCTEC